MPARDEHLSKAEGNESFAMSLTLDSQPRIDWALVSLFYSAVHYVEAYLAPHQHLRSHTTRDNVLGRDSNLKKIFSQYQDLKFYGYNARYSPPMFSAKDFKADAIPQFAIVKAHIRSLL
jgi:hypothetical protein